MNQLPLDVRLRPGATFASFFTSEKNEAVHVLKNAVLAESGERIYLWGGMSSGKTHLLQAACHLIDSRGNSAQYVDLSHWIRFEPDALGSLDESDCLCLDNIEQVAGRKSWEQALFHLADRMKTAGRTLVVSGSSQPDACGLTMPELISRLGNGRVRAIKPLNDPEKTAAMMSLARQRGFALSEDVAQYLVEHRGGDPARLFALLDELDHSSLAAKRKISKKMAKEIVAKR